MIQEGDYVIFQKADFMKIFPVKKNKPIMIDRNKCHLENLIGKPYGFQYEIKEKQLHFKTRLNAQDKNMVEIVKDNRNLLDKRLNQKLTSDEIESMKKNDDITGTVCHECEIHICFWSAFKF